jgi:hypothetical protein
MTTETRMCIYCHQPFLPREAKHARSELCNCLDGFRLHDIEAHVTRCISCDSRTVAPQSVGQPMCETCGDTNVRRGGRHGYSL